MDGIVMKDESPTKLETNDVMVLSPLAAAILRGHPSPHQASFRKSSWSEVLSPPSLKGNKEEEDVSSVIEDDVSSEIEDDGLSVIASTTPVVESLVVNQERPWWLKATCIYERTSISRFLPVNVTVRLAEYLKMTDCAVDKGIEKSNRIFVGIQKEIATGERTSAFAKSFRPLVQKVVKTTTPLVSPLVNFSNPYLKPFLSASVKLLRSSKTGEAALEYGYEIFLLVEDYCTFDECSFEVDSLGQD
jgi:hypothetical protein